MQGPGHRHVIFPRRMAGDGIFHRPPVPITVTLKTLEAIQALPLAAAAEQLGIPTTALKRACRALGIRRWSYQKLSESIRAKAMRRATNSAAGDPPLGASQTRATAKHRRQEARARLHAGTPRRPGGRRGGGGVLVAAHAPARRGRADGGGRRRGQAYQKLSESIRAKAMRRATNAAKRIAAQGHTAQVDTVGPAESGAADSDEAFALDWMVAAPLAGGGAGGPMAAGGAGLGLELPGGDEVLAGPAVFEWPRHA